MHEIVLQSITEHFTHGHGQSFATVKEIGDWIYELTVIMCGGADPGDVVTIEIEIHDDQSVTMDGLHIEKRFVLDWLVRLVDWKRNEAIEIGD